MSKCLHFSPADNRDRQLGGWPLFVCAVVVVYVWWNRSVWSAWRNLSASAIWKHVFGRRQTLRKRLLVVGNSLYEQRAFRVLYEQFPKHIHRLLADGADLFEFRSIQKLHGASAGLQTSREVGTMQAKL